jgi:putative methyltransferase (TIGR04325 family)
LDNQKQAEFGRTVFDSSQVKFLTDIPSDEFELVLLIGTLQYIENWKSIFDTLQNLSSKVVYIARTPFVSNCDSFCAVQSITPSTLNFKIGEENLNIISFKEFQSACKIFGWKVHQLGIRQNYAKNFKRFPSGYRDVFYQPIVLSKL